MCLADYIASTGSPVSIRIKARVVLISIAITSESSYSTYNGDRMYRAERIGWQLTLHFDMPLFDCCHPPFRIANRQEG